MLTQLLKRGHWVCLVNEHGRNMIGSSVTLDDLLAKLEGLPHTLKDNHRSTVKRGHLLGVEVVAKRPIDKNRRRWAQFCSLFTQSEAAATIHNLSELQRAGVESVTPIFALEKRIRGMVVDSWLCYEYRAGEPCGEPGLSDIITLLHGMHEAGFCHGDPTWNNFLRAQDGVLFTIDTKAKPCRGAYHATHDFILLKRSNRLQHLDLKALIGSNQQKIGYWFAIFYASFKRQRARLRDKLKKNRAKNR